jgi:hypothetical protein
LFGDVCEENDISVRIIASSLTNLCSSSQNYIYPKKARLGSEWYYIINTGEIVN